MTISDSPSLRALGFIIFGAAMVSFTSVFVELAHVGPTVSAFYRMFFGGIILLVIALIRKERLGWRLVVAIPFASLGLFLIVRTGWGQQGGAIKLGVIYGLLTAFSYALYILTLRKSQSAEQKLRYSLFANMTWISLISAALLAVTVIIEPESNFVIPDLQTWGALVGLGIMGQVLGWVFISKGLPEVDASVAGLALLLQPALAFMWDILFFNRPTTALEYVGAGIVLAAIYLGSSKKKS